MVEFSKMEILNVIKQCGFFLSIKLNEDKPMCFPLPLLRMEPENPGILFLKNTVEDSVAGLWVCWSSSVRQCIPSLIMYLCYFYFKRLSMFSVPVTMCFLPTLLFCAPRHLGWGSRDSWGAQVKDEATRRGDGHPRVSPCHHGGPPQQRLWVWHWGEALSTAPVFSQGAGRGRAGTTLIHGAHSAALCTSTYRRQTTNKWRNSSFNEICPICFKKFKISVGFNITEGWNCLKRPHTHPSAALRYGDGREFWIYFTKCTRNFLSLSMTPNCSSCEI